MGNRTGAEGMGSPGVAGGRSDRASCTPLFLCGCGQRGVCVFTWRRALHSKGCLLTSIFSFLYKHFIFVSDKLGASSTHFAGCPSRFFLHMYLLP